MDQLQTRLQALEQRTRTVEQQLRWWRGLAGGLLVLAVLTWSLPLGMAKEDADGDQKGLEQRVAALESLLKHFSRKGNEVTITGANLHIVNGLGHTDCWNDDQGQEIPDCPNGLGDLIVGYNEPREEGFGENIRTGSHNVVVGQRHNFSRFGGLVVGDLNTISGDFAVVSGGVQNTAFGLWSVVSGGGQNLAGGSTAVVSGGSSNIASETGATVSGGYKNRATGQSATASGGRDNTASDTAASVSGGYLNKATGPFSAVSGGQLNVASGNFASVSGGGNFIAGQGNVASGDWASVTGGQLNVASGDFSVVGGGLNRTAEGEFDWVAGPLFADE